MAGGFACVSVRREAAAGEASHPKHPKIEVEAASQSAATRIHQFFGRNRFGQVGRLTARHVARRVSDIVTDVGRRRTRGNPQIAAKRAKCVFGTSVAHVRNVTRRRKKGSWPSMLDAFDRFPSTTALMLASGAFLVSAT